MYIYIYIYEENEDTYMICSKILVLFKFKKKSNKLVIILMIRAFLHHSFKLRISMEWGIYDFCSYTNSKNIPKMFLSS